jgi:hypothetical protein
MKDGWQGRNALPARPRIAQNTSKVAIDRSVALRAAPARSEAIQQANGEQSIACSAVHDVGARLARRLMRLCNTDGETKFTVTQEASAEMFGIGRNAVSLVAQATKEAGIIRFSRGLVEIIDVDALQARSCECYAAVMTYQRACETRSG